MCIIIIIIQKGDECTLWYLTVTSCTKHHSNLTLNIVPQSLSPDLCSTSALRMRTQTRGYRCAIRRSVTSIDVEYATHNRSSFLRSFALTRL